MRPQLFNPGVLLFNSLLCSLLLHWLIFSNFTLVFPAWKEPHKPKIIFLGPILRSSDMANERQGDSGNRAALEHLTKIQNASRLYSGSVDKPSQQLSVDPKYKRTLKTSGVERAEEETEARQAPLAVNDIEIDREIEPYKPLRLKDSD